MRNIKAQKKEKRPTILDKFIVKFSTLSASSSGHMKITYGIKQKYKHKLKHYTKLKHYMYKKGFKNWNLHFRL